MYTGVTSANADQSNLGFLLSNQRTKETKFYNAPAPLSGPPRPRGGRGQDLGYTATFPILLNIANEAHLAHPRDAANLVRLRHGQRGPVRRNRMVRRAIRGVATRAAPDHSLRLRGRDLLRCAGGQHLYFIRLEQESVFYALSAAENPLAVILNPGDQVTITHAASDTPASILDGYTLRGRQGPVPGRAPHPSGGGTLSGGRTRPAA